MVLKSKVQVEKYFETFLTRATVLGFEFGKKFPPPRKIFTHE